MRHYCTLFDSNYLAKGLCLHESLMRHSSEPFTLHVLAMDMETLWLLDDMKLEGVNILPLRGFENALHLEHIRKGRTWTEYCWTCASNLMAYLMPEFDADGVTYLDADLYFFSDPKVIFDEIGTRSIGITPHRFPEHRKHKEANGIFNVGLVSAKNSDAGIHCIEQWAANCRDWCYNRVEEHHACGDQLYLNTWETDYPGEVCAISNIGVNLAPWNMEQYIFDVGPTVDDVPVVFFHFHEFKDALMLTYYPVTSPQLHYIYRPYLEAWHSANERIRQAEARAAERRHLTEMESQRA